MLLCSSTTSVRGGQFEITGVVVTIPKIKVLQKKIGKKEIPAGSSPSKKIAAIKLNQTMISKHNVK